MKKAIPSILVQFAGWQGFSSGAVAFYATTKEKARQPKAAAR
jgi:hypothetical protein